MFCTLIKTIMKPSINLFLRRSLCSLSLVASAQAVDYTVNSGETLNLSNGSYTAANLLLQGGTVSGSGNYNAYGASVITGVTVSGSAASTITGSSWFNMIDPTIFTVADVTGDSTTDLLVSTSLRALPSNPDYTYSSAKIIKEGLGTMEITAHSFFWGGLTLNGGTLKVSGGNGGYGFFSGNVTVNSGTTLSISSDGTGFGFNNGWKPTSLNINGGTVNGGGNHVWGISGGVNMTGGTLQVDSGSFQWNYTNLNTNASADTATVAGPLYLRGDGGYTGLSVNVADGAAATDLLISGNISETYGALGIIKSGEGTLVLSGNNSYTGPTTVSAGTLVLSGNSSAATGAITVNAGVLSLGDGTKPTNLSDASAVSIAAGAVVNLNFTGSDTVGSLNIGGSGALPAGIYNSSHPAYGSYFTGTGSLVIAGADGTWTSLSSGNWSDAANWQSNTVATGYDATATFSAASGATVTVDSSRIIGNLSFETSDYTLAGTSALILDSSGTPVVSVATGKTAAISANVTGTRGIEKVGAGTLVLTGVKSYTGGTTVTAGTLELNNSSIYDQSVVSGTVTVASGASLKLSGFDYTGFGRLGSTVTTLNVNGGTVNSSIESWVTGATVNLTGGTMTVSGTGRYQLISSTINSFASATTSQITGNLLIRKDYGSSDLNIDVADGAATTDLSISGSIQQVLSAGVNKLGTGKLLLSGTNTYTGNTVVYDGDLEVNASSSLRFAPTTSGVSNQVSGSFSAKLSYLGTVDLQLGGANLTNGNAWTLFDLASFSGSTPLLKPATVNSTAGAFTKSGTTWTLVDGANTWTFEEATGVLTLAVASSNPYNAWGGVYGLAAGSESGDLDQDGMTNFQEFAFGLIPNDSSSVDPIAMPLDHATGVFSYRRRAQALTNLTYTIWYSTDLATWVRDNGATEGTPTVNGEVEIMPITLTNSLLANPALFIQVRAD